MGFKQEQEVRILDVDPAILESHLSEFDARFVDEQQLTRYVYDVPRLPLFRRMLQFVGLEEKSGEAWVRLRCEGSKTFLTIKRQQGNGVLELEVEVSNFRDTNLLLQELGISPRAYHENLRRRYLLGPVTSQLETQVIVDLVYWPGLKPLLEIEAPDAVSLSVSVGFLGFAWQNATTMSIVDIYKSKGFGDIRHMDLRFTDFSKKDLK